MNDKKYKRTCFLPIENLNLSLSNYTKQLIPINTTNIFYGMALKYTLFRVNSYNRQIVRAVCINS